MMNHSYKSKPIGRVINAGLSGTITVEITGEELLKGFKNGSVTFGRVDEEPSDPYYSMDTSEISI